MADSQTVKQEWSPYNTATSPIPHKYKPTFKWYRYYRGLIHLKTETK